jgi:uncharacterized membrane protein
VRPELPTLSGSPASLETWDSLGAKGRDFIGKAPSSAQLAAFNHKTAMNPIRVYVGLKSAPTLEKRADLAAADLDSPPAAWASPRVAHLQYGSDPVTWWLPNLIWGPPNWLDTPRAPDVSPAFAWYPFVTFWQVTCDLGGAAGVPDRYGHNFGRLPVEAWAAVIRPPGWTATDTARLEALLHAAAQQAWRNSSAGACKLRLISLALRSWTRGAWTRRRSRRRCERASACCCGG